MALLLLVGAAGFLAPARLRLGSSSHQLTIYKPWDGGEQTFILMSDPSAPRQYRFPQEVPPGGRLHKNSDGSVDVLDTEGTVVSQMKPPWAYDALGRPVRTWYDLDGDTIVQHVEPGPDTVFPIVADPDKSSSQAVVGMLTQTDPPPTGGQGAQSAKSGTGAVEQSARTAPDSSMAVLGATTGTQIQQQPTGTGNASTTVSTPTAEGSYTARDDGKGNISTATSTVVPESAGTVDTRITNSDGTTSYSRSVPDGDGGVTTWTANPDGSNSVAYPPSPDHPGGYIIKNPAPGSTTPAETVELGPGGRTGRVIEYNLDGTLTQADFHQGSLGPVTDITNPDGTHTQVNTVGGNTNGRPDSIITEADGSRYVITHDGTPVPIDRYNDTIGGPNYANQYDPVTGTWHSDPVTHRGPIHTNPDGTSTQEWFFTGPGGEELSSIAHFDRSGNVSSVQYSDYTGVEVTTFETIDGITVATGTRKMDAGNVIDDSQLVFDAALAVTGIPEIGYTTGRMIGGQLLKDGVAKGGAALTAEGVAVSPLARVPGDATVRTLKPDPNGGAQVGVEFKWLNENGQTVRLRAHGPDGTAPPGSNAAIGPTYRIQIGGRYLDEEGNLYPRGVHNPNSPNFDPEAANATHIPWPGNVPLPWKE